MEANLNDYEQKLLAYIQKLTPDVRVKISEISTNPQTLIDAVKHIIDLRLTEVEFTADYQYIIKREEVNYEKYAKR